MRSVLSLASILILSATCMASEFDELVQYIPRGANGVMAIDVAKTLDSPLAKKNGWDKKFSDGRADRPLHLPPEADKVLAVAQFDIVRDLRRNWDVALFGLTESIPLKFVARAEGGYMDSVEGVDAAWIPSDAYVLTAGENALLMQAPANRQAVGRWLSSHKSGKTSEMSEYLGLAVATVKRTPHIVMALDTTNALQSHRIEQRFKDSKFLKKHSLELEQVTELVTGLRGILLEISFTDKASATARIDFSQSVPFNGTVAKDFVLGALDARQMSLPGVESWNCTIADKSIVLYGDLTMDSLRRLLSLMEPPSTKFSSLKDANVEEATGDDMAKNSLAYFQSTQALMKDLRQKAGSHNSDAYWIDRYTTKIDHLPILHVDDDLLEYGQNLSETLRVMSGSRKAARLEGGSAARNELSSGGSGYGYGNYSYSSPSSRAMSARNAIANSEASGSSTKIQGWNLIDNATAEVRREMTKRYDVEF